MIKIIEGYGNNDFICKACQRRVFNNNPFRFYSLEYGVNDKHKHIICSECYKSLKEYILETRNML